MEKEWEKFRDILMESTNDVWGMRRLGGLRRKGSEWWNEVRGGGRKEKSFRNGYREVIRLPMTDTGHRE